MSNNEQSDTARPASTAGRVIAALIGLTVAVFCLLVFIFRLSGRILMLSSDLLFFYFVICGAVAGIGLLFVYRLLPRRSPRSLVDQSGGVAIQPIPQSEVCIETGQPAQRCPPISHPVLGEPQTHLVTGGPRLPRYSGREAGAAISFLVMAGMAVAFMVGTSFARNFLPLAIVGGVAVALGMYWRRHGNLA